MWWFLFQLCCSKNFRWTSGKKIISTRTSIRAFWIWRVNLRFKAFFLFHEEIRRQIPCKMTAMVNGLRNKSRFKDSLEIIFKQLFGAENLNWIWSGSCSFSQLILVHRSCSFSHLEYGSDTQRSEWKLCNFPMQWRVRDVT